MCEFAGKHDVLAGIGLFLLVAVCFALGGTACVASDRRSCESVCGAMGADGYVKQSVLDPCRCLDAQGKPWQWRLWPGKDPS